MLQSNDPRDMFALPGVIGLLLCVFIRPQELSTVLAQVPLIYIFFSLAVIGWAVDLRLRWSRVTWSPVLPLTVSFWVWSFLSAAIMARWAASGLVINVAIELAVFLSVSQTVQTLRAFQVVAVALLAFTSIFSVIGVHQGLQPTTCVRLEAEDPVPTGVSCTDDEQCKQTLAGPNYMCEHVGLLGTTSIGQRVRYRGIVFDPNELALVSSIGIPLTFALLELRTTWPRLLLMLAYLGTSAVCIVFTKSRSGMMAFMMVLFVYGLRRFRVAGGVVAVLAAIPLMLLGGRGGAEAEESGNLRLGYWAAAIQMARDNPLFGVGFTQFVEHQPQTAHSSFMLALGERGFPGLFLWTMALWTAFKILVSILQTQRSPEAREMRAWTVAMLAGMCGFMTSALFLSLTDHYILWVFVALTTSLYTVVRRHDPKFQVKIGGRDLLGVGVANIVLVAAIFFYTRSKGF